MSEHLQFTQKQIVWASVDQYPPWPAKIVRKLTHNGKTVYKVNFFGDPTYSYLHSHSVQAFNISDTVEYGLNEQNSKLQRAFQLAKFSISKQSDNISITDNQSSPKPTQTPHLPIPFEQTCIHSKDHINLPQKTQQLSGTIIPQTDLDSLCLDSISPSNVMQLLETYQKGQIAQRLGNLKRKQIICFQNCLKQNLLLKYKLHAVDILKEAQKPQHSNPNPLKDLRTAKFQKKKKQEPRFDEREQCIRKIQKILYQKGMERHRSQTMSIKIMSELQKRSCQGGRLLNSWILNKENVIRVIEQISLSMEQIRQVELEYIEKHIFSFVELQYHQNKLEEGSRMTQINQEFPV